VRTDVESDPSANNTNTNKSLLSLRSFEVAAKKMAPPRLSEERHCSCQELKLFVLGECDYYAITAE
jgi:hypothetical protein